MNIPSIRADLGRALALTGASAVTRKVGSVVPPAAILGPYSIAPHQAFGGSMSTLTWTVTIVVADAADGALEDLDGYLSDDTPESLIVALEGYQSDHWDSLNVLPSEDIQIIQVGATEYVGCQFQIEVFC